MEFSKTATSRVADRLLDTKTEIELLEAKWPTAA